MHLHIHLEHPGADGVQSRERMAHALGNLAFRLSSGEDLDCEIESEGGLTGNCTHTPFDAEQLRVIDALEERGAGTSAEACARAWAAGEPWHPDARNAAMKGLWRTVRRVNRRLEAARA